MTEQRDVIHKPEVRSKVVSRFERLFDKRLRVRMAHEDGPAEDFVGVLLDVLPAGNRYFFLFEVAGKERVVSNAAIVFMEVR